MPLNFRKLWRHSASPVTVITTALDKTLAGMTISSLTSVSLGPPKVLVSFNCQVPSRTARVLQKRNKLVLNMLSADPAQVEVAKAFAGRTPEGFLLNPFEKYPHMFVHDDIRSCGIPLVANSCGALLCDVQQVIQVQDHEVVIASVLDMWSNDKKPLLYRDRKFWTLGDLEVGR